MYPSLHQTLLPLLLLTSTTTSLPFSSSAATCDKAILQQLSNRYLLAQSAGTPKDFTDLFASSSKYVENNKDTTPGTGILSKSLKIDNNRTIYDLVQCATFTELISASGPYVIGTQIFYENNGTDVKDYKVKKMDSIVTTTNAWLFNASKTLEYVRKETWSEIPEGKRDKREVIKAAGDAYMDMWSNATAHEAVPWGTPCVRLEGSAYTGTGKPDDSCKPGIPTNHNQAPNSNRRYVIDEAMGSVSILCVWEHMMNAADSHEFRLENGKLRYVHTMTECGGKVCKL